MKRIALVRGPGLSVFELQSYQPLMSRFELTAFGLAQHSVDVDTLTIPCKKLRWKDSLSGRSAMNAYRSRVKGQRYFMPGLDGELTGFDLIHSSEIATTFSWQCVQEKKKRKIPLVITSTENIRHPAWNDPVRSGLKKEIVRAADFFFALTPDARDVLMSEGVEPERIDVIPFGLDLERFSPGVADESWRRHFGVKDDEFVVVYAGRFVWEKGIYDLAGAVREMDPRKLRVLFVGRGPERAALELFIGELGLNPVAACHEPLRYGQMEQLYRLADVVILPSLPTLGVREQFGMTLAEAMACGRAVVAARCGSMPWVIGDGGLLAETGNSSSIAECLNRLRESPELRKKLAKNGRKVAEERYDVNKVAGAIAAHFDRLLEAQNETMSASLYLRVDDFPAWTESMDQFVPASDFEAFHQVLASHGIPYMLAVTPQPALTPLQSRESVTRQLTPEECSVLRRISEQGATIGLHGVTHRSRIAKPHSEFIDLDDAAFRERIAYGDLEMRRLTGIRTEVFVPPFNRMSRRQLDILGERFRVVCGGPETTPAVGQADAMRLPSKALYLPSYTPWYGRAHEIHSALDRVPGEGIVCLTLHWEWERRRGYDELTGLCAALAGRVRRWQELVQAA